MCAGGYDCCAVRFSMVDLVVRRTDDRCRIGSCGALADVPVGSVAIPRACVAVMRDFNFEFEEGKEGDSPYLISREVCRPHPHLWLVGWANGVALRLRRMGSCMRRFVLSLENVHSGCELTCSL